jgi:L-threonylcarbamoyladenylate synthase
MSAGPEEIAEGVRRLAEGRLVAFPTETVYGLGADALSGAAVRRVFQAKGRPSHNPLIVHVSDLAMARRHAGEWPRSATALAERFWPGPLSIIVPRGEAIPTEVTAGGTTMAVRCPAHPITLALIEAFGKPIVGPSANRSGGVSPTAASHVRGAFSEAEVLVLDGGPCTGGIESTVVSVAGGHARILRPGLITPAEIEAVLGAGSVDAAPHAPASGPLESPGLLGVHYAPTTPAKLVGPGDWAKVSGPGVTVSTREDALIRMPANARGYAAHLYAALRQADAMNAPAIFIEDPRPAADDGEGALWAAIMDRLTRATTPFGSAVG